MRSLRSLRVLLAAARGFARLRLVSAKNQELAPSGFIRVRRTVAAWTGAAMGFTIIGASRCCAYGVVTYDLGYERGSYESFLSRCARPWCVTCPRSWLA